MANEAVPVEGPYEIHDFTVANTTGIAKHTSLKFADPRTASASTGSGDVWAGIAVSEKVASDGSVNLGVYTKGIFKMTAAVSAITAGQIVSTSGANLIKTATEAEIAAGKGIGKALENFAGSDTGEVFVGQF